MITVLQYGPFPVTLSCDPDPLTLPSDPDPVTLPCDRDPVTLPSDPDPHTLTSFILSGRRIRCRGSCSSSRVFLLEVVPQKIVALRRGLLDDKLATFRHCAAAGSRLMPTSEYACERVRECTHVRECACARMLQQIGANKSRSLEADEVSQAVMLKSLGGDMV